MSARRWADAFTDAGRQPVRLLHPGDHHAPGRPGAPHGRRRRRRRRARPARPPVSLHGLAHHRRRRPPGPRRRRPTPPAPPPPRRRRRDLEAAARRAALEGGAPQGVGADVACGGGGFAEDTAPADALVAVPDGRGGWVGGRHRSPRPGRGPSGCRVGTPPWPCATPWSSPPGRGTSPCGRRSSSPPTSSPTRRGASPAATRSPPSPTAGPSAASCPPRWRRRRAAWPMRRAGPVRVVFSREDVVRYGPKRPPIAAGVTSDGSGVMRVARTPGSDRPRPVGAGRGVGGAGTRRWRRWPWRARRCRPTSGARGGPRPPCSSPRSTPSGPVRSARTAPSRCGLRRERVPRPLSVRRGP